MWKCRRYQGGERQAEPLEAERAFPSPCYTEAASGRKALLPFAVPVPKLRAQGALVMSSAKSHPGCAGKHQELQQRGPASLFWLRGKRGPTGERGPVGCGVRDGRRGGRESVLGGMGHAAGEGRLRGEGALEHHCWLKHLPSHPCKRLVMQHVLKFIIW